MKGDVELSLNHYNQSYQFPPQFPNRVHTNRHQNTRLDYLVAKRYKTLHSSMMNLVHERQAV